MTAQTMTACRAPLLHARPEAPPRLHAGSSSFAAADVSAPTLSKRDNCNGNKQRQLNGPVTAPRLRNGPEEALLLHAGPEALTRLYAGPSSSTAAAVSAPTPSRHAATATAKNNNDSKQTQMGQQGQRRNLRRPQRSVEGAQCGGACCRETCQ